MTSLLSRHSRESGNPVPHEEGVLFLPEIPAFAGMTDWGG